VSDLTVEMPIDDATSIDLADPTPQSVIVDVEPLADINNTEPVYG